MNGLSKETWINLWKPELHNEAGMIFDALDEIHKLAKEHPLKCRKKYVTKTQLIIFILALLAFENVGWPLIAKIFM